MRYRAKFPLEYFKTNFNIDYTFIYPGYKPVEILNFIFAYFSILFFRKKNSLIVIQKVRSNRIYANALKLLVLIRGKNIAYDIDDADYLEHKDVTIRFFIRNCSSCIVGSKELMKYTGNLNSSLLYLTSPTIDLGFVKQKRNSIIHIGWIGCFGGGHKKSMIDNFFPAIKSLPFEIQLTILGITTSEEENWLRNYLRDEKIILDIPFEIDWSDENFIQAKISEFDIGIATLLDDELHRSKSAFKVKQYLTCGVPVLSSNIGENRYFIQDGVNGYFCNTINDFGEKIISIGNMTDADYLKLCNSAKASIDKFNLENYCQSMISHFND